VIETRGLGHGYAEGQWLLRGIDFAATRGEIVAILGPNGRGKTTLLKAVMGFLRPREGMARVEGTLGYVPQFSQAAFPFKVMDMVMMGRARHVPALGAPKAHDARICRMALERLGIAHFAERPFDALSGGERQLVLVARALASECDGLVLDEPTSALDFRNQSEILSILRRLAAEDGLTVLFTTHFPQHALHVADKVLLLYGGADYVFGPCGEVLSEANLSRLYDMPVRRLDYEHEGKRRGTVVPVYAA
jgi:iron complex transport system ATP-binding protein